MAVRTRPAFSRWGGEQVTDSTVAPPPPNQRFSSTIFSWLLHTRNDAMKKMFSCISLVAKDYRSMTSGRQGAPYFRIYGRELVSKPAISLKKGRGGGGATVERLQGVWYVPRTRVINPVGAEFLHEGGMHRCNPQRNLTTPPIACSMRRQLRKHFSSDQVGILISGRVCPSVFSIQKRP